VPGSAPSARSGRSEGISLSVAASLNHPAHLIIAWRARRDEEPRPQGERRSEPPNYSGVWLGNNRPHWGFTTFGWCKIIPSSNPLHTDVIRQWRIPNHFEKCSNFEQSLPRMMTSTQRWSTHSPAEWSQGWLWWSKSREEP
jgi:hypothetical protein